MKSSLIDNRHIRVFISSTFIDMQDERAILMKRTFPNLRMLAAERDVTLTEVDLRWGITEEESESGKVVEICLREIENSVPFFIGIIGNRYGWVPKKEDLDSNVTEHFAEVNDYLDRHLSVTEMEMQFGVLSRKEDMHAYFFIKDQEEGSDNPVMLGRLKDEVQESKYPSSTYNSPEDLSAQVESAFITLLDRLYPNAGLSEMEKERIGQRSFMNQLCQNYIKDERNFEALDSWLGDNNAGHLIVTGASGLGKSALIANWIKEKQNSPDCKYNIVYHFTGNGGSESSSEYITRTLINDIHEIYEWRNDESSDKLEDLFNRISLEGKNPLLIVIDAINQIVDTDNAKLMNWLPIPSKNIKILFSTLEEDRTMEVFRNRNYPVFTLRPLDLERRSQLIMHYLKLYAKSLTVGQVGRIVANGNSENNLVLKTLLDELIKFGVYETLDDRIDYYLAADTIGDFFQAFLASYEEEFGKDNVEMILSLIAVSKHGLTEQEIIAIAEVTPLAWSQMYCLFATLFVSKRGIISFSHIYVREAVELRYLREKDRADKYRKRIIAYYKMIESDRGRIELLFHYFKLEKYQELIEILSKKEVLKIYLNSNTIEFYQYWNAIQHVFGESKFSVYIEKIWDDFCLLINTALFFHQYFHSNISLDYLAQARKSLSDDGILSYLTAMSEVLDSKKYYKRLLWYLNKIGKIECVQFADALIGLSKISVIDSTPCEEEINLKIESGQISLSMEGIKEKLRSIFLSMKDEVYYDIDQNEVYNLCSLEDNVGLNLDLTPCRLDYEREQILIDLDKEDVIFNELDFEFENSLYHFDLRLAYFKYALDIINKLGPEYSYKKYHYFVYLHDIYGGVLSTNQNNCLPFIDEALSFFIKLKTNDCPEVINLLKSKCNIGCRVLKEDDTEGIVELKNLYYDLIKIASKYYGNLTSQLAEIYSDFSIFLDKIEDFEEEFNYYNKILDIYEYLQMNDQLEDGLYWVERYLIKRYFEVGTKYKLNDDFMRCLNNRMSILHWHIKYSHPLAREVATAYNNVGAQYRDLGEYDTALEYIGMAYEISKDTGRTEDEAAHLNRLGRVYALMGEKETAKAKFREAIRLLPEDHPEAIDSKERLNAILNEVK